MTRAASEEPGIRSFIAVDLNAAVRAAVGTLHAALARCKADVRWVRPEGMHVTLKFLGSVAPPVLEQVHTVLRETLAGASSLHVRARGLGTFPSWRRPRVVWVGLRGDGLVDLAAAVDAALTPLGFAPERRAFTPHLTLGRVNGLRGWSRLEAVLKAHLEDDFGESDIDAVTIYRSTLQKGGAVYARLWTIPLQEHR